METEDIAIDDEFDDGSDEGDFDFIAESTSIPPDSRKNSCPKLY